jgi:tyrosine-protein kinase Etk/Wzc
MRSYATEDNPQMVIAVQQLNALKIQLAKLSGTDENVASDIIVPKGNIPEAGMEYLRRLRDVRYYQTMVELIAKQFEVAKLDEAREGAIVQVADVAVPPDKRSFPKRTLTVVLMMFLGLLTSCGWCIFADRFQRLKRDPAERKRLEALRASLR